MMIVWRFEKMRRTHSMFILFFLWSLFIPVMAWAGGVVQELYVDSEQPITTNTKLQALHSDKNCNVHTGICAKLGDQKPLSAKKIIEMKITKNGTSVVLYWKEHSYKGHKATKYLIYRRIKGTDKWELIGTVDGDTLNFADLELSEGISYDYKVVAIHQVGDDLQTWDYPQLNFQATQPKLDVGFGCQMLSSSTTFSWFLLLFLLPLFRRKRLFYQSLK